MDNWEAEAHGIREGDVQELAEILSPFHYDEFSIGNHIDVSVVINGTEVERYSRGEREI